jgi:maltooligosyltrehalose trehalohydrolase
VWAPLADRVEVELEGGSSLALELRDRGYHEGEGEGVEPGRRYRYRLHGPGAPSDPLPDPASRWQPEGVHGPSVVVSPPGSFDWSDEWWRGRPLAEYVIYELHVGTFTPGGTFASAVERLPDLVDLGVTAVELMPVAQFPGSRNWGYDGVFPYAVQGSYGGPDGLRRLVEACHGSGLAVVLDVVHNHAGPEGNVLGRFGPYFTDRYLTPWGPGPNLDGPGSDEVRAFLVRSAKEWFEDFHIDALRLDAIQGIVDTSARPFLRELAEETGALSRRLDRPLWLIAESDLGDVRVVTPRDQGGLGLDAQWADDFHHAVHAALTGERQGYYVDFGSPEQVATAMRQGFVYTGQYSGFRRRRHGSDPGPVPAGRFVVCIQNHDQVGNHQFGERLADLVSFEQLKLAAGLLLLSPFVPLLFMGEEYGETAPFHYFVSHGDPRVIDAVRRGRAAEAAPFGWAGEPPDPQDEATFEASRLRWELREDGSHAALLAWYRELLRVRRESPALRFPDKDDLEVAVDESSGVLLLWRWSGRNEVVAAFNLGEAAAEVALPLEGRWRRILESEEERFGGAGPSVPDRVDASAGEPITLKPHGAVLLAREGRGARR